MKNTYCLIALLSLLCSCTGRDENPYEYEPPVFPHEYEAEIKPLNKDIMLGNVFDMQLCDSIIIIKARNICNDNVFQVISTTGEFKLGFAHTGRSDNEMESYSQITIDREKKMMYAGSSAGKMLHIDLAKAIAGDKQFVKNGFRLPNINRSECLHSVGGRILHTESHPRFFITDIYTYDTVARCNFFPNVTPHIDSDTIKHRMYFSYNTTSAVRPDGKKFVSMTSAGMLLEIFDIDGDEIRPAVVRRFHKPEMRNIAVGSDNCIMGGYVRAATDKYIYAAYYGCPFHKLENAVLDIIVFDWDGNEACRYKIKDQVGYFAVTPDDKRLYCWAVGNDAEEYLGYMDLVHD